MKPLCCIHLFLPIALALAPACMMEDDRGGLDPAAGPADAGSRAPLGPDDGGRSADDSGDSADDGGASRPRLSAPARIELLAAGVEKYRGKAVIDGEEPRGEAVRVTFDPASGPRCLRGAPYAAFYVDRGARDTMLLLEGGGACWSALCAAEETADESVREVGPALDDPQNPFRSWNLVFAPYCDGSAFWGDNDLEETDGRARYHRGQQNLAAALDLAHARFATSERFLVAGFSAGGYGTVRAMLQARLMFPDAELLVLADSGAGMQNPDEGAAIEQRLDEWKFAPTLPPSCEACAGGRGHLSALFPWLLERDEGVRIAFLSYYEDPLIGMAFNALDGPAYKALLLAQTDPIAAAYPDRFKRFMLPGNRHVVTFDLPDVAAGEVALADWLHAFAENGEGWTDVVAERAE